MLNAILILLQLYHRFSKEDSIAHRTYVIRAFFDFVFKGIDTRIQDIAFQKLCWAVLLKFVSFSNNFPFSQLAMFWQACVFLANRLFFICIHRLVSFGIINQCLRLYSCNTENTCSSTFFLWRFQLSITHFPFYWHNYSFSS